MSPRTGSWGVEGAGLGRPGAAARGAWERAAPPQGGSPLLGALITGERLPRAFRSAPGGRPRLWREQRLEAALPATLAATCRGRAANGVQPAPG